MSVLSELEPKKVFHYFEELCKIPHGSYNTKAISDYCMQFAADRGLEAEQDDTNNVIIRKNGTAVMRNLRRLLFRAIWIWYVRRCLK